MTTADLLRIACLATLIATASRAETGELLPGSSEPFPVVFQESTDFVAVCVAENEPRLGDITGGTRSVVQRFRLLGLVIGRTGGRSAADIHYRLTVGGFDRAVRKGERVIWLARSDGVWMGRRVFEDTPENRARVYSNAADEVNGRAHGGLDVRAETTDACYARGRPIPVRVQIENTSESAIALWSTFSALQFEALAEDGEPVACRKVHAPRFERAEPLIVEQYRGPAETADLADLCDWLPSGGEQRSYTLLWRGKVRLGDSRAEALDVVSQPVRLTVRDPSTLAWGAGKDGAACGLASEEDSVSVGGRLRFHWGLRSDSVAVGPDIHIYHYSPDEQEVHFTFRNIATGTVYERVMDRFQGGPAYDPKAEDFLRLRDHPVLLWTIPVRLLDDSGEQVPAGSYEVTATYEPRQAERSGFQDRTWRIHRTWRLHEGPLVSGPVIVRVQHADPESVEIRTNSAIELKTDNGPCFWIGSPENPTILHVSHRPGFSFHVSAVTSVAVGAGALQRVSEGGYGGQWIQGNFTSSTWANFPHALGAEACRALAAGESLSVRVDVTIYETAGTYGFPARGDTRVVWQGSLQARRP